MRYSDIIGTRSPARPRQFWELSEEEKRKVCTMHWAGRSHALIKRLFNLDPTVGIAEECARWVEEKASEIEKGFYPEVSVGDVGVLTEEIRAEDTEGISHLIPAGTGVRIVIAEPNLIGFRTTTPIEGKNYFKTPYTLEFRRKFKATAPVWWRIS